MRYLGRQIADLFAYRSLDGAERQQLNGKVLREHQQVAFVIGCRVDQRLHLVAKLRICLADAEQQNAKTQGRKEIPFGSRAWAAFGRILGEPREKAQSS